MSLFDNFMLFRKFVHFWKELVSIRENRESALGIDSEHRTWTKDGNTVEEFATAKTNSYWSKAKRSIEILWLMFAQVPSWKTTWETRRWGRVRVLASPSEFVQVEEEMFGHICSPQVSPTMRSYDLTEEMLVPVKFSYELKFNFFFRFLSKLVLQIILSGCRKNLDLNYLQVQRDSDKCDITYIKVYFFAKAFVQTELRESFATGESWEWVTCKQEIRIRDLRGIFCRDTIVSFKFQTVLSLNKTKRPGRDTINRPGDTRVWIYTPQNKPNFFHESLLFFSLFLKLHVIIFKSSTSLSRGHLFYVGTNRIVQTFLSHFLLFALKSSYHLDLIFVHWKNIEIEMILR